METKLSSKPRIDERVFFTMGLISFVCLIILAFKIKNNEPCKAVSIKVNPAVSYEKTMIFFKAETQGGSRYEWDFGDGNKPEYGGSNATHSYTQAGRYSVIVTVNGNCYGFGKVDIEKAPIKVNRDLKPKFAGPLNTRLYTQVIFRDSTPDATSWEWNFGENDISIVDSRSREAVYTYRTTGYKEVYLRINGRQDRIGVWQIYVDNPELTQNGNDRRPAGGRRPRVSGLGPLAENPTGPPIGTTINPDTTHAKPSPPPAARIVAPDIQPREISDMLKDVVSGRKEAADFSIYFCGELNIPVKYNDQSMRFNQMCKELRTFKKANKIQQPEVKIAKDNETNCIKSMNVTVHKRGLLDRIIN